MSGVNRNPLEVDWTSLEEVERYAHLLADDADIELLIVLRPRAVRFNIVYNPRDDLRIGDARLVKRILPGEL